MENITQRMNLVIDYIETHLTSEIDPKEIERLACCSYFDVGRIFSLIAGINISDYIRKRKLTLAGTELKRDHAKVIDIAQKYGYDSPVSFARAFQAFHGFNPSIANKEEAILNGLLTLSPTDFDDSPAYLMPFELGEGMKYDEAKMMADIEKYGLYTYEDFAEYCTYEQFVGMSFANWKVAVGKGYITWDDIVYLIESYLN